MPRNGQGQYTKPPNTTAQPNTTIKSAMFNSVVDDLVVDANTPRPITAGGTGAATVEAARTNLELDKKLVYSEKSADYAVLATDNNAFIRFTAAATATLPAAGSLGSNWHVTVLADGGAVTIDPSAAEQINGAATLLVPSGYSAEIYCSGTAFFTEKIAEAPFDFFLDCIPAWISNTSISFTAGSGVFGGKKHVLPAYTKTMSAFSAGNNGGMLDTGSIGASKTYFLFAIRNISTGVSDYLTSLSLTPTIPSGWELNSGARIGSLLTNASSQIVPFWQVGNEINTDTYAWFQANATVSGLASPSLIPIGVSVDIKVILQAVVAAPGQDCVGAISDAVANNALIATPASVSVRARSGNDYPDQSSAAGKARSNTAGQLFRSISVTSTACAINASVCGWHDYSCKRLWG
ncbi:hypothetical protein FHX08_004769 [Rhizobium sp. BK529]|uniref:hypothetical protein n=1 Tax=Rhizobium sp. BK529 TaxID=2586983 RepID=UPI00160DA68C|nr:hypothetical protein [Rhizobium sp. BK529]MBB3594365.1 hypothetical protein [Rhizobium sp. BK529]